MRPDIEWHIDAEDGGDHVVPTPFCRKFHWSITRLVLMVVLGVMLGMGYSTLPGPLPTPTPQPTPSALKIALARKYWGTTVQIGSIYGASFSAAYYPYTAQSPNVPRGPVYGTALAAAYMQSFQDFENKAGIHIQFWPVKPENLTQVIENKDILGPDVIEFESPAQLYEPAKAGKIINLATIVDLKTLQTQYDQKWLDWATLQGPSGPIIAGLWGPIWIRNVIWYPKAAFDRAGYRVPTTWQELLDLSDQIVKDGGTPWCLENGFLGDGQVGLPAYVWISDIMLRTAPSDFEHWLRSDLKSNTLELKQAIHNLSDIWFNPGYAYEDRATLNHTYAWDVARYLFTSPPKCWLLSAPSWATTYDGRPGSTLFDAKEYGSDYAFFLLPPINPASGVPVQVEGHITAVLHDRPEVRALMEYLATGAQLEKWIKSANHIGYSPHKLACPGWSTNAQERALDEAIAAAERAGNLYNTDGYWLWLKPKVAIQFLQSISAYVNGDVDLDAALKQVDAVVEINSAP